MRDAEIGLTHLVFQELQLTDSSVLVEHHEPLLIPARTITTLCPASSASDTDVRNTDDTQPLAMSSNVSPFTPPATVSVA